MTEGEENIIIKGVLLEAISRDFSEELSNNKEVSVSPRFKRQMMAMMNNPNKWAERHKRDYRRRFVKVVQFQKPVRLKQRKPINWFCLQLSME